MHNNISDLAESKLILLYILHKIKLPISNLVLSEIVLSNNILNYFTLQQYIFELISSNLIRNIDRDGKTLMELSDTGQKVLELFKNRISTDRLDQLDLYLDKHIENIKKEITVTGEYTIDENNNFIVALNAYENGSILIDLKVSVATNKQAKELCTKWKENSSDLYSKILNTLIN